MPTKRRTTKAVKSIVKSSKTKKRRRTAKKRLLIPTGSTLYNLSVSDTIDGAWECGKMSNLIGDSSAGKTFLGLSSLADCAVTEAFDDVKVDDDIEAFMIEEVARKLQ